MLLRAFGVFSAFFTESCPGSPTERTVQTSAFPMLNTLRYLLLPVLNASGPVFIWLAAAILIPFFFSLSKEDGAAQSFLYCAAITFSTGLILSVLTRRWKRELTARHGFLLVTLIWTTVPLFSTIPFLFETPDRSFSQLYFEMMSCLSTTGATMFTGLDELPISLNGWRCFLSWIGGMGLIVLSVAILPLLGVGGAQIIKAEISGPLKENRLTPRIADTAKALYIIYLAVSVSCAIAYHLAGMNWADAIMHMMTTVSLSGIAAHDASFGFFNSASVDTVAIVFMIVSGFNFSLHFAAWHRRNIFAYFRDAEALNWIKALLTLSLLTIGVLWLNNVYPTMEETLRYALFSVVSVASTSGFATVDYSLWPSGLPIFMMLFAAFASCAGSTGGGIKMIRLMIVLRLLRKEILTLLYPKAVVPIRINRSTIDNKTAFAVLIYLTVWLLTLIAGIAVLMLLGLSIPNAFSSAWAMLSNLGPGLGSVGPNGNYSMLTDAQLWCCTFLMLLGRLELFTVFALFTRAFWRI